MMDYLITLDGPNHAYSSSIYNRMLSNDAFTLSHFQTNKAYTPNNISFFLLSFLLSIFNSVVALKVFHLLYIILFALGFYFWNKSMSNIKQNRPYFIVVPLIFSFLFFSGFYNFVLSFIILFFALYFYENTKMKSIKKYVVLCILLLLLYLSHSIVFLFAGLAMILFEIQRIILDKTQLKSVIKNLSLLALSALPCFVLSIVFLSSRSAEVTYLPFETLFHNFISSSAITTRSELAFYSKSIFKIYLISIFIYTIYKKIKSNFEQSDYLLWLMISTLLLYFILPDSVGYAGVFSVRVEYFFWVFYFAWIVRNPLSKAILNYLL